MTVGCVKSVIFAKFQCNYDGNGAEYEQSYCCNVREQEIAYGLSIGTTVVDVEQP